MVELGSGDSESSCISGAMGRPHLERLLRSPGTLGVKSSGGDESGMIATSAADFITNIQEAQMRDIPYFRSYIPDADPVEAKTDALRDGGRKPSVAEAPDTIAMIERVAIGETAHISFIIADCTTISKEAARFRITKCGRFKKTARGYYKRTR